ncbi:MAG: exodeoxyribonuclease VII small subunit [Bacteroidaceae bacterium]|jgi:exodeoxyribonuclease VII small subunit|nr:exodeoxyribonuclease VII small subunit [Bacteroidaceae bacterium]MBO7557449.1 exodeoxyribonuclease VII small subunit [Bacteroidaceae bacterium]MBQ2165390.1 exodeoxyribonuclease VII small subunit [Bacteroidaceae bacterium]MBQ2199055.1 exodeoxyribonuclease VII small subunit [Bacteroidaceae bacterium]MBQ2339457.1 exodeoxyribonuclease VII small subunit [Bacteroidaceae bacterium]
MDKKLNYTQAMQRLEEIVAKIESGEMDIDSLTDNLKEAKELVNFCKEKLTKVENEVKTILDEK